MVRKTAACLACALCCTALLLSCSVRNIPPHKEYFTLVRSGGGSVRLCCMMSGNTVLVPVEQCAALAGIPAEPCGRCGSTLLGGKLLIEWNTPYARRQDCNKKYRLGAFSFYKDGVTYADCAVFSRAGIRFSADVRRRTIRILPAGHTAFRCR